MLKSMTGFGRGEVQYNQKYFLIELKSVNHRYVDINIKMPKSFTYLEENLRQKIKEQIRRGRVDIFITHENLGESDLQVKPDLALAKEYLTALEEIQKQLGVKNDISVSLLAKFPDVIKIEKKEEDEDEIWRCLEEGLTTAIDRLMEMRIEEGYKLKEDLVKRLDKITELIEMIRKRSPEIVQEYRQRLTDRIKEILDEGFTLDDNRVIMEVALFADKSNITEEIVRFKSHIHQFRSTLEEEDSVGRKLDFILQEMNREVNTIGSKANDLTITNFVVDIKSELEKMREQVQNIE